MPKTYQVAQNSYIRLYGAGKCVKQHSMSLRRIEEKEPEPIEVTLPPEVSNRHDQELEKISKNPKTVESMVKKLQNMNIKTKVKRIPSKKIALEI
jgi:hypothetical protein